MRFANRFLLFLQLVLSSVCLCNARGGGCKRENSFEASVLVIHEGMTFDEMDTDEFEDLGSLFVEAWDKANDEDDNDWCDDTFFRNIKMVSIEPQDQDVTHSSTHKRLARKAFVYNIDGGCKINCTDFELFAPHSDYTHDQDRDLGGVFTNNDFTECKCGRGSKQNRGPTEDEFLPEFQKLVKDANLKNVKAVYDVVEYRRFACSDQQRKLEHEISLQLSEDISEDDEKVLEDGYVDAYNTLVKYYCHAADSYILEAEFVSEDDGMLRARRNLRRRKAGNLKYITADRDAEEVDQKKSNTFDEAGDALNRRRLEDDNEVITYGHTCYCPLRPLAYRAPNSTEITAAYQELLEYQMKNGDLHGNYIIESMMTLMTKGELQCGSEAEEGQMGSAVGHDGTITVPQNSNCTISAGSSESPFYTVVGNIKVEDGAVLTISGEVTTTALIEVKKGGTLRVLPSHKKCPMIKGEILATEAKGISISSQGEKCDILLKKVELTEMSGPAIEISGVKAKGEIKVEECDVDLLLLQDIDGSKHQVVVKKSSITGPDPTQVTNVNAKKIDLHENKFTAAVDISANTATKEIWIYENDYKASFVIQNNAAIEEFDIDKNDGKGDDSTDIVCSENEVNGDFSDKYNDDCN